MIATAISKAFVFASSILALLAGRVLVLRTFFQHAPAGGLFQTREAV